MDELKKAFEPVKEHFDSGLASLQVIVNKINEKFEEIGSNENEIANLTGEISKLKKQLEQTEKQRDEMRQGLINAQNDLADGVRRAATQREELETKLKLEMQQVIASGEAIQKKIEEVVAENETLKKENAEVRALYEECKDHPVVVAAKIERIKKQREQFELNVKKKLEETDKQIEDLKAKLPSDPSIVGLTEESPVV